MDGAPATDPEAMRRILALARDGKLEAAREVAERLFAERPDEPRSCRLLGLLRCQTDDLVGGIALLARGLEQDAGDAIMRRALVRALADNGEFDRARSYCTSAALAGDGEHLWRLLGQVEQSSGHYAAASSSYEQVLRFRPEDVESWSRLGDTRHTSGDFAGAAAALHRAGTLRPDDLTLALNLAAALVDDGRPKEAIAIMRRLASSRQADEAEMIRLGKAFVRVGCREEALAVFARASHRYPDQPAALVETGLLYASEGEQAKAEAAYRDALVRNPLYAPAYLYLGLLFEHSNRAEALAEIVWEAEAAKMPQRETALLRALSLRRSGAFAEAAAIADDASETAEPARRAQIIGELADRIGDEAKAFAAFTAMNEMMARTVPDARQRAERYRAALAQRLADLPVRRLPARAAPPRPRESRSPAFLMGFPRSGTTLLDTLLMGHPDLTVLEELPVIQRLDASIGGHARWGALADDALDGLRQRYFKELGDIIEQPAGTLIVDKHPLHVVQLPLIQILFPDAPLVFLERHPCDVVLSCFVTNFAINDAMANCLDLENTAALYDLMMRAWNEWRGISGHNVHVVRYEELVASPTLEMRRLLRFLSVDWSDAVLDHRDTAMRRGYISSASYAQVGEAIHNRSVERWRRYRAQLAPVLPIVAPWAEAMGYEL